MPSLALYKRGNSTKSCRTCFTSHDLLQFANKRRPRQKCSGKQLFFFWGGAGCPAVLMTSFFSSLHYRLPISRLSSTRRLLTNSALSIAVKIMLLCPCRTGWHFVTARSVRLSVPLRSCLGYRHAGFLQLSQRRPPEMCGLRSHPRRDAEPPRFLPLSNCHRQGAYRLAAPGAIACL